MAWSRMEAEGQSVDRSGWGGDGGRGRRWERSEDSDSDGQVDGAACCCNPEGLG